MSVRILLRLAVAVALVTVPTGCGEQRAPSARTPEAAMTMTVTSTAFSDGRDIPRRHTCDGENLSPPLAFGAIPSGTRELALLVEDPDAPSGTFVHWVAWGIDPAKASLPEGESTPGSGTNGFGKVGYGGPCPPRGPAHRYVFIVFALSGRLDLSGGASADELRRAVGTDLLGEGRLTGRYARA
jgi:Raf kinase inhibitor-like YbhB/YbcL family protein